MTKRVDVEQNFVEIESSLLINHVRDIKGNGYRLAQACATAFEDKFEVIYSFDKEHRLVNLRVTIAKGEDLESITGEYWAAFIYENEMHDLFGIQFNHMILDYEGKFFKTAEQTPWNPNK